MHVNPYLSFEGKCDQAIDFYKSAAGAEVSSLMRYKEMPGGCPEGSPSSAHPEKVMHAELKIGDSTILASDGRCTGQPKFEGITLAISVPTDAQGQKIFNGLAAGGKVTMPLGKTFFSSQFGMLQDRFGVGWLVITGP
ncbi:MAG TPA: VOC family protein [Tepidisphaeraceae bacterium]|jgi:PhnB protein|nr:VOC family protein [Tepidisphaeraceae bacterium]